MLYSEMKCKQVVNLRNCDILGYVSDLEIDKCTGSINKICVTCRKKWIPYFFCEPDYVICYNCIKQIGPDIISVEI